MKKEEKEINFYIKTDRIRHHYSPRVKKKVGRSIYRTETNQSIKKKIHFCIQSYYLVRFMMSKTKQIKKKDIF